ncbi:MAG: orotate phosphoribosyltransferase [Candidatus Aenigmarchaeota archaeon]|nr:orotate phosphoribosyltransferase [Candidatus Aenigmarchaeota archaeon]
MNVAGLCSICGKPARPSFGCRMCGSIVCSECFDKESGLCKRCKAGMFKQIY